MISITKIQSIFKHMFVIMIIKRKDYTYAATSGHEEQRSIVLSF